MNNIKRIFRAIVLASFVVLLTLLSQGPPSGASGRRLALQERLPADSNDISVITAPGVFLTERAGVKNALRAVRPETGTDRGEESEPNNTLATADLLGGAEGKIKGHVFPGADIDYFAITVPANSRVYAAVMTGFSTGFNSILELRDSSDAVLEADLDDGSFGTTSSSIAGYSIPAAGTYYLRVRENATSTICPYFLYYAIKSAGDLGVETEPNNTTGTPSPLPFSGSVSAAIDPAADVDFYSVSLAAGDTIFLSLDLDPERDNVQWNGRLGLALFGTANDQVLVINDGSAGSAANPLSEAFFFTVKDAGTYYIYVDDAAGGGGPAFTYHLNVAVIPAPSNAGCTIYTGTDVPKIIPATSTPPIIVTSAITVPPTANNIRKISVFIDATHALMQDLDIHLTSPAGNDNGVITDVGDGVPGGAQTGMNWWIDDDAAIPPAFALSAAMRHQPDPAYRMDWFRGENPAGVWTLTVRDDFPDADGGMLNNWSLQICEETPPAGSVSYSENFESGTGGFTHSGTADEWEYGTPATTATGTNGSPRAAFLNCNSGVKCWKTDLDNTYNANSSQDLLSPHIDLTGAFSGTATLSWAMKYQLESGSSDHAFVEVREAGNPANSRIVWQWYGPTMTDIAGFPLAHVGASAGWGIYRADISNFIGKTVEVRFHLDSNGSLNFSGMAIDDVTVRKLAVTAAGVSVSGRVLSAAGYGIPRARVTLAGPDNRIRTTIASDLGYFSFEDVEVGNTYVLSASRKGHRFSPVLLTVMDEVTDAELVSGGP